MSTFTLPQITDGEDKSSILKNRIRKNYRHLRKWAKRTQTNCFRLYDRDIKEYPLAIEFYDGRFCVQFFSYDRDQEEPFQELSDEVEEVLHSLFGSGEIFWRTRIKRTKIQQYEKRGDNDDFFPVLEYGVRFRVNLNDYLDTGLFLDHRETRQLVAAQAKGKRVLNLFAYTCSFSVHAAMAGAAYTKSVDMSNTYTEWGKENFLLNGLSLQTNEIVRADCLKFLRETKDEKYDLIIIDPPTLSRSKKMENFFDIQKDHPFLIRNALRLLLPGGTLFFSTNSRHFILDPSYASQAVEITEKTIPLDFHNKKIHRCWIFSREK